MSDRFAKIFAICFLTLVFFTAVFSMKDDSATYDEVAHLPAGYSYLTQRDMRLNPEHPPLIKDLSALPLLFLDINFPAEIKDWQDDTNGQWGFGRYFLYQSGNPIEAMLFWGRLPIVLILLLLGFYIFKWTKEICGNKAAVLALFFFSFSPTLLAHGRFVTTDVGAAIAFFAATYYFVNSLQRPTKKNVVLAGIFFGLAQLCKFSLVILIPFFGILILVWVAVNSRNLSSFAKQAFFSCLRFALMIGIALLMIGALYQYHVWGYPPEKQVIDTQTSLETHPVQFLQKIAWAADKPILRPFVQYFLGVFMVFQRAAGGQTTYFLGEVSAAGWKNYFPIVYAIKEPLAFHLLTLLSVLATVLAIKPFWRHGFQKTKDWLKLHFPEFAMLVFIAIYWTISLTSNLNIGVRHLLPTFPFVIALTAITITRLLKEPYLKLKYAALGVFIIWQAVSVIAVYPHFLAYFNELVGGPDKGYLYTVDSNLDWGQDLKRLVKWTEGNQVDKIYLDYFGGGDARYYLQEKFEPWWASRNPAELPSGSYLAVSATLLEGERGLGSNGYYLWLDKYEPVAKIGYSIFIYRIE
ncbi:MAG: glycosyltransferase family 39 protein [bacterium]